MSAARLPSLSALRAFEAAARHLSFKDAADELNVTHAAVSHQIKALEAFVGSRLFIRGGRGVTLTEEKLTAPVRSDRLFARMQTPYSHSQEKRNKPI